MVCIGRTVSRSSSAVVSPAAAASLTVQAAISVGAPAAAAVAVAGSAVVAVGAVAAVAAEVAVAVVRAGEAAADATLRVVGDWGATVARQADAQLDAEAALAEWHMAAADAVGLNASIRVLDRRAADLGVDVRLPDPLDLAYRNIADIGRWVLETEAKVTAARTALAEAAAKAEWGRLVAALPVAAAERVDVTEALRRFQATLARRYATHPDAPETADAEFDAAAEADLVVARLDPDATSDDREAVLRAAANVATQADARQARTYLLALRRRVEQANPRAVNRRQAAAWLQALEHPVVAAAKDTPPGLAATRDALRAAIGSGELDPASVARARVVLDWAGEVARAHYRRGLVAIQLRARGYVVTESADTGTSVRLQVTRAEWRGESNADVWVDADGVHGQIIREFGDGDEADLANRDRREDLGAHLADIAHDLSHRGVDGMVAHTHQTQHRHEVGAGYAPSSAATTHEPRAHRLPGPSTRH